MQFNIEDVGATKKKLSVELPAEMVQAELDSALKMVRKGAKIKGFRPGKVPAQIIKRYYGPQVEQDVAQKLINDALPKAIDEADLHMVAPPVLEESDLQEGQPFKFAVTIEVRPEFEIDGYEGLALTREKFNITDEMVAAKLEELRQAYATTKSVEEDRAAAKGDLVVVDYKAYIAGEEVPNGSNPNYQTEVGSGGFHPDFDAALEGLTKGQTKEVVLTFEEKHYNPKLAGQEVRFEITLKDIKEKILPELNDDFAKDLGQDIKDMEGLKDLLRKDMTENETGRVEHQVREQLKDELLKLVEFEVPESLVAQELDSMMASLKFNLQRSGLSMEAMGVSEAKLREENRGKAADRVRLGFILDKIAEKKEIKVEDQDIEGKIMEMAREAGQSPEIVREYYNKNNMLDSLADSIREEKTLNYLLETANIEDAEPTASAEAESDENDD